jgi:transcriptional regulator with XRE-family HTH domain
MKGKTLRTIRKRLGLTQTTMAQRIGVTKNTVARWERNEMAIREPMARLIHRLEAEGS